jgi:hypothetical protein
MGDAKVHGPKQVTSYKETGKGVEPLKPTIDGDVTSI